MPASPTLRRAAGFVARAGLRASAKAVARFDHTALLGVLETLPWTLRKYLVGHRLLPVTFPRDPSTLLLPTGKRARLSPDLPFVLRQQLAIGFSLSDHSVRACALALLRAAGPNALFLDVGANCGVTSLIPVMEGFEALLLEPIPAAAAEARHLLGSNARGRFFVAQLAASDDKGDVDFFVAEHSWLSSLDVLEASRCGPVARISCSMVRIDDLVKDLAPSLSSLVLKVDVEGHEWPVLKGASETISKFRAPCLLEVFRNRRSEQCFPFFLAQDYLCYGLEDPLACTPIPTIDAFEGFSVSDNFLFLPREHNLAQAFGRGRIPIENWRP